MEKLDQIVSSLKKAVDILSTAKNAQSNTGRYPVLIPGMIRAIKMAGLASVVSVAACSQGGMYNPSLGYNGQAGYQQQQQAGLMGLSSTGNVLGTLGGGALGGFVGSQFGSGVGKLAATGVGVILGGVLGNYISRSSPPPPQQMMQQPMQQQPVYGMNNNITQTNIQTGQGGQTVPMGAALGLSAWEISMMHDAEQRAYDAPSGTEVTWRNPQTGNGATIIPSGTNFVQGGMTCRNFALTVYAAGQVKQGQASACKTPGGSWHVLAVINSTTMKPSAELDNRIEPEKMKIG